MLYLRRFLKLPSPVDLGWSEYNALEDADWSDEPQGKTWQDWHKTVKKMHPVKYFIAETAADWFRHKIWWPIKHPLSDAKYWFVSHFIPSRRYHMLDLRQPRKAGDVVNHDCYRYGWRDVPEKMLYAMFNLLGEYLNKEKPHDLTQWHTREEIEADAGMKRQQDDIEEARAIYHWWAVEQHQEHARITETRHLWWEAKKNKLPNKEEYWNLLKKLEEDQETKTDEMIARLMKIRRSLWT